MTSRTRLMVRECELVYRKRATSLPSPYIASSEAVYALMQPYVDRAHESLWAVILTGRQRLLGLHECARGHVDHVPATIATLFRAPLVGAAVAMIVVHNHPSDDPAPSAEDLAFTERVREASVLLGLPVLDHVIIAASGYHSMLDAGQFKSTTR